MKHLVRLFAAALTFCVVACASAPPADAQVRTEWSGVSRIVVIGDLEGDYEKFVDMLRTAELITARGDWSGGAAHLVQLGDIPDRGPNSRAIMLHLRRLEPQARRAGGRVHALIGNHEAMNVSGDLRYVHPGEYEAFRDSRSARRQQQFFQRYHTAMSARPPQGGMPIINDAYRAQWNAQFPLGYVEHRAAWAVTGELGRWVAGHDAVVRINDTLFVHGGLGPAYAHVPRGVLNDAVRSALRGQPDAAYADILTNQEGPLWYRGLSLNPEDGERANVEALLAYHGVNRIVVGHTKRASTVYPRFGGRVLIADIGVPEGYTDPHTFLIIENGQPTTVHRRSRVPLRASTADERCAYFNAIAALDGGAGPNARLAERCAAPEAPVTVSPDSGR